MCSDSLDWIDWTFILMKFGMDRTSMLMEVYCDFESNEFFYITSEDLIRVTFEFVLTLDNI
jgi:hypothetical protein